MRFYTIYNNIWKKVGMLPFEEKNLSRGEPLISLTHPSTIEMNCTSTLMGLFQFVLTIAFCRWMVPIFELQKHLKLVQLFVMKFYAYKMQELFYKYGSPMRLCFCVFSLWFSCFTKLLASNFNPSWVTQMLRRLQKVCDIPGPILQIRV